MGARTKEDCDQLTIQRGFALLRNGTEGNDGLAPPEGSLEREFEENANGRFPSFLPSHPSICGGSTRNVVPMSMTGTATEIVLYFFGDHKSNMSTRSQDFLLISNFLGQVITSLVITHNALGFL